MLRVSWHSSPATAEMWADQPHSIRPNNGFNLTYCPFLWKMAISNLNQFIYHQSSQAFSFPLFFARFLVLRHRAFQLTGNRAHMHSSLQDICKHPRKLQTDCLQRCHPSKLPRYAQIWSSKSSKVMSPTKPPNELQQSCGISWCHPMNPA